MAGRIPDQFIQQLLARVDIVDVINQRVPLKKAGREYKACCPFHDEKTPSFTVSQQKQFYHCFGCGAHGTAVGFLMEYEGLDFVDAIEELAGIQGLEVPREAGKGQHQHRDDDYSAMLEICSRAADYYRRQLPGNPRAVEYLRSRGLDGETAKRFAIGYAPPGYNNLSAALGGSASERKLLIKTGLLAEKDSRSYDRFRDRIMFPIHDRRGRVIAFGGRLIEGDGPKYMNSPETPLFHKGKELYGLHLARAALSGHRSDQQTPPLLVVEGYMDVVALAQNGLPHAVATLGTATTGDHVEMLFRATPQVVFCFDGDRAGREAAWRAAQSVLPRIRDGRQARFLFLPEGEDPDSLVRARGAEGFRQQMNSAQPLSEFVFEVQGRGLDDSVDDRARLAERCRPLIETIPEGAFRDLMEQELSRRSGLSVPLADRPAAPVPGQSAQDDGLRVQRTPVRHSIALLLQNPGLAHKQVCPDGLQDSPQAGVDVLQALLARLQQSTGLTTAMVLEQFRGEPHYRHLSRLAASELPGDVKRQQRELADNLASIAREGLKARFERLRTTARQRPLDANERQQMLSLQQQLFSKGA